MSLIFRDITNPCINVETLYINIVYNSNIYNIYLYILVTYLSLSLGLFLSDISTRKCGNEWKYLTIPLPLFPPPKPLTLNPMYLNFRKTPPPPKPPPTTPEHTLWLSVLERAYRDAARYLKTLDGISYNNLQNPSHNPNSPTSKYNKIKLASEWRHYGKDAYEWFKSPSSHPQSFLWVCDTLSLEPTIIRQKLAQEAH